MELLRLIIARERPDLISAQIRELKEAPAGVKPDDMRLTPREQEIIEGLKQLPVKEQEVVYAVVEALLRASGRKDGKSRR